MITSVQLTNFKCFEESTLRLGALTLLTGLNGTGKSTLIQALLLVRQSVEAGLVHSGEVVLNGELITLGTAQDVLFSGALEDAIAVKIVEDDGGFISLRALYSDPYADTLTVADYEESESQFAAVQPLYYLPAERIGPRRIYEISGRTTKERRMVGSAGTLAVAVLDEHWSRPVRESLRHDSTEGETLLQQASAWLGEISPGAQIETNAFKEVSRVALRIGFEQEGAVRRTYSAINVGFGLSYVLSIIVAILVADRNSLILVENPEAHLHPRGQSAMGALCARAAAAGIQIVVESHSDHLLNGIRLAVKDGIIRPDAAAIHYFERRKRGDVLVHTTVTPEIDTDGRINRWPRGFFDEYARSLDALMDIDE